MMERTPFAIEVTYESEEGILLRLSGELDLSCEWELQERLDGILERSRRTLIIDLAAASFVGVGVLTRLAEAGREFRSAQFRSAAPIVEKVLRLFELVDELGDVPRGVGG